MPATVVQTGGGATTVQIPVPAELKRHPQWETLVRRAGRVIREGLPAVRFEHFSIVGVDGRGLKEAVVYIVSGGLHSRPQPRMVQQPQPQPQPQPRQLQQQRGGAAAAASAASASVSVAGTTAASVLADVDNADASGSDNLFPISQQMHVPPPPPSSPPAKYRKILATAFSTLGVAAIIMSEQAPHASGSRRLAEPNGSVFGAEPANILGIYHNASDDQMLTGRFEWLRLGFRHLNVGHQHRVAFSMLVPMTGHALLVPLGAWFQLAILRDKLGWRTHNMVVRSLHEQIDTALREKGDVPSRPPSCGNLLGANVVTGAVFALATGAVYKDKWPLVIIAMGIPQFLFAGDVLPLEWSRVRALVVMCTVRITTLVASLEAAAGLVQLVAQLNLGPLVVLGLVCCLDVLLHSTGQGKWRWRWVGCFMKVAALTASCVCVDVLLAADLGSPSLVASLPLQLFLGMVPAIGAIAAAEATAERVRV